jgi:uncharacterized protein (TIGR02594 family)
MRCFLFLLLLSALAGCSKIPHVPLEWAEHEIGVQTWMEARPNPRIMEYINAFTISTTSPPEEIAREDWCGFFAAWCLKKGGYLTPQNPYSMTSWCQYGKDVDIPQPGDVAVFWGHVAFYFGRNARGERIYLGGDQGHAGHPTAVCRLSFGQDEPLCYRRPVKAAMYTKLPTSSNKQFLRM